MKTISPPEIPGWIEAMLPDAGHFIQEEEPQRIAEAIQRVVAKI